MRDKEKRRPCEGRRSKKAHDDGSRFTRTKPSKQALKNARQYQLAEIEARRRGLLPAEAA
jgi:hypothetical protein